LIEDGTEPGSVIAIKPDVAVDNDCCWMLLELLEEREQDRQLPLVEGAGLIWRRYALTARPDA
jgi:hypothetical protein